MKKILSFTGILLMNFREKVKRKSDFFTTGSFGNFEYIFP
jgi:hypothetical protein